jgi:exodeoxyribonuclease VII small subunit
MPEPNQAKPGSSLEISQMSYEQAFAELEKVVSYLESNDQPLESAMAVFERGQNLARHCANLLDQAELKIQQLTGDQLTDLTSL